MAILGLNNTLFGPGAENANHSFSMCAKAKRHIFSRDGEMNLVSVVMGLSFGKPQQKIRELLGYVSSFHAAVVVKLHKAFAHLPGDRVLHLWNVN